MPELLDRLRNYWERQQEERPKRGTKWKDYGLIFPSDVGTPLNGRNLSTHFHNILEAVGMPPSPFHRIRHTASTRMEEAGISRSVMQALLGHADLQTSDRYTHATKEALTEAVILLRKQAK